MPRPPPPTRMTTRGSFTSRSPLEDHAKLELSVGRPRLAEFAQLRVRLAWYDESEALHGGVKVGLVAVPVPRHILLDLGDDLRGLLIEKTLRPLRCVAFVLLATREH